MNFLFGKRFSFCEAVGTSLATIYFVQGLFVQAFVATVLTVLVCLFGEYKLEQKQ